MQISEDLEDAVGGLVEGVAEVEAVVEEAVAEAVVEEDIKDDLMGSPVVETIMAVIIDLTMKDGFREITGVELKVVTTEAMTVVDVGTRTAAVRKGIMIVGKLF